MDEPWRITPALSLHNAKRFLLQGNRCLDDRINLRLLGGTHRARRLGAGWSMSIATVDWNLESGIRIGLLPFAADPSVA